MSHGGGGGGQPSCAGVPVGKYVRRVLRAASGRKRIKDKQQPRSRRPEHGQVMVTVATAPSSSSSSSELESESAAAVRVVLASGVVETYAGVVLACTVIRKHPPGLCLAHTDVFRNPHGAVVRPLEPLFPGQKFYLLPETTMRRLQEKIPESSVGAFDDDDNDDDANENYSSSSSSDGHDKSFSAASSSDEERDGMAAAAVDYGDDGYGGMGGCYARKYFVAKEQWEECHSRQMAARGLAAAVEAERSSCSSGHDKKEKRVKKSKTRRKTKKKSKRRTRDRPALPCAMPAARRTWEPSLPAVEEEMADCLPSPAASIRDPG